MSDIRVGDFVDVVFDADAGEDVSAAVTHEIEFKKPSKVSLMPEKQLNTMTLEEVLDLIAFLEARGSSGHRLYRH